MKKAFLILFIVLLWTGPAGALTAGSKAPDFQLSDQHDRLYSLATSSRPIVLIASDRSGEEQNHQWGKLLGEKYGNRAEILGVADLRAVPSFLKSRIKNDFKKDKNIILLDWEGMLFTAYGLAKGVANVVVIDVTNTVRCQQSGNPSSDEVDRLFKCLDAVLIEPVQGDQKP